jgi:threonine/homoserine/homoserine lactone efflux protein
VFVPWAFSLLGYPALILTSPLLFEILRWSGVVFLIWLGCSKLDAGGAPHEKTAWFRTERFM